MKKISVVRVPARRVASTASLVRAPAPPLVGIAECAGGAVGGTRAAARRGCDVSAAGGRLRGLVSEAPGAASFSALGTTATVVVVNQAALPARARNSFASGSARSTVSAAGFGRIPSSSARTPEPGHGCRSVPCSCGSCGSRSMRPRRRTGRVDPTLGAQLQAVGYDRTFALVRERESWRIAPCAGPQTDLGIRGARRDIHCVLRVPPGVRTRPRGHRQGARRGRRRECGSRASCETGVLVSLGGDLAVAGDAPAGRLASADRRRPRGTRGHRRPDGLSLDRRSRDLEHRGSPLADRLGGGAPHPRSAHVPSGRHSMADRQRRGGELRRSRTSLRRRRSFWASRPSIGSPQRGLPARCVRRDGSVVAVARLACGGPGGMTLVAATGNAKVFWYLTRGMGVGALVLLTASVALGRAHERSLALEPLAAVRHSRAPPQPHPARDRVRRRARRDDRGRRVHADRPEGRSHPVRVALSPHLARPRRDRLRPSHRPRRDEPSPRSDRLPGMAVRALARVCLVAGRARARARHGHRRAARVDALDRRGLRRGRRARSSDARCAHPGRVARRARWSSAHGVGRAARDRRLVRVRPGEARLGASRRHARLAACEQRTALAARAHREHVPGPVGLPKSTFSSSLTGTLRHTTRRTVSSTS